MRQTLVALAIGFAGGGIAALLHVPAPWLAGSLVLAVAAVAMRVGLQLEDHLRTAAFLVLGIQIGMTVSEDTLERAVHWPLSILLLALTVVAVVWASHLYYTRLRGWDAATSLFASLPGALSLVILLATQSGADMRRVVVSQCLRLFFLIIAMPSLIVMISAPTGATVAPALAGLRDLLLLLGASAAAGLLFDRLKVPAGLILGAALMSAGLGLSGAIHGVAPDWLLIPANVVLGVMIALRFKGITWAELMAATLDGLAGLAIAVGLGVLGALVTGWITGLPLPLTLLAFAPGGLEAMTIMAFALKLDPAYVAAHQVARYVGLVLFMPPVTAYLLRKPALQGTAVPVRSAGTVEDN
jgi:membrane AbrB-like protein